MTGKISVISAMFLLWGVLSAMAPRPGTEVPVPEVNFKATVVDDQDISTKCENVSWEGRTYFTGTRGKGIVTIPFEKVKKVTVVGRRGDGRVDFQVMLRSGDIVAVTFDEEARLFGTTDFGTYRILAKNIKEIVFE